MRVMIGFLVRGRVRIKIMIRVRVRLGLRLTLGLSLEQLSQEQMYIHQVMGAIFPIRQSHLHVHVKYFYDVDWSYNWRCGLMCRVGRDCWNKSLDAFISKFNPLSIYGLELIPFTYKISNKCMD